MHEIGLEEVRISAENGVFGVLDEICTKQRVAAEAVEVEVLEEAGRWRTTSIVIGHLFARHWHVVIMRWRRRYTIRHSRGEIRRIGVNRRTATSHSRYSIRI